MLIPTEYYKQYSDTAGLKKCISVKISGKISCFPAASLMAENVLFIPVWRFTDVDVFKNQYMEYIFLI